MRSLAIIFVSVFALQSQPAAAQQVTDRGEVAQGWVNAYRAQVGRRPLRLSGTLAKAAAAHARDMARKGYFSHIGSNGGSISDRARRVNYSYCYIAENIAKGQRDVQAVLRGWAESHGHRRNLLLREVDSFALVEAPGRVWVMVLGRDGC